MTRALAGYTIVVTRPAAQAGRFIDLVAGLGGDCIGLPTLVIERLTPEPALVATALGSTWDWTIYTSTNAVDCALATLGRLPAARRTAAVGRATARALEREGVTVDVRPETANSEGLLATDAFAATGGQSVLLIKGAGGRDLLRETLQARGAKLQVLEVYRRAAAVADPAAIERLGKALAAAPQRLVVAVTSADVLAGLLQIVPEELAAQLRSVPLLVPGARVATAAVERGWHGPVVQSATAEDDAMAAALRAYAAGAQPATP